jgi:hypothetical protein
MKEFETERMVAPIGLIAQANKFANSFEEVCVSAQELARCMHDVLGV